MPIATNFNRFEELIEYNEQYPQILVEGDSWFAIPTAKNIIKQINKLGKFNLLNLASSGDEAIGMMNWQQKRRLHRALEDTDNEYNFKALMFSAGGNDIVGPEMWHLLKEYTPGATAIECINNEMWHVKLTQIEMIYRELFLIRDNLKPELPIIIHCYDRAVPSGEAHKILWDILKVSGPWMKPSLDKRGIDSLLHQDIVSHLLESLREMLIKLSNESPYVHLVNSFDTLDANEWGDELHPTSQGFKKIVHQKWKPLLEELSIL